MLLGIGGVAIGKRAEANRRVVEPMRGGDRRRQEILAQALAGLDDPAPAWGLAGVLQHPGMPQPPQFGFFSRTEHERRQLLVEVDAREFDRLAKPGALRRAPEVQKTLAVDHDEATLAGLVHGGA